MASELKAIVLAAGKGTRMREEGPDVPDAPDALDAPKVMREVLGRPLIWYVLDELSFIGKKDIIIVVGYKKNDVIDYFSGYAFAEQTEQLGTGHAVMAAGAALGDFDGAVLVCYGDMPAIRRDTYEALVAAHIGRSNDCTLLTGESSVPLPYGRVVRDDSGGFKRVVEEKDCTREELGISELNSGVYVFRAPMLLDALKSVKRDNSQGEYYLTDAPAIMRNGGAKIGILKRNLGDELIGVNTPAQLKQVEEILRKRV